MSKKLVSIPLTEIAERIGATIIGDMTRTVSELTPFDDAVSNSLTFIRSKSKSKALSQVKCVKSAAIILHKSCIPESFDKSLSLLPVEDPLLAVIELIPLFFVETPIKIGISLKADIDPSASIGKNVTIGAFTSIGAFAKIEDNAILHPHVVIYPGAQIGARSVLHSNVTIREECVIGADSIIQNGAVIGADGFGYAVSTIGALTSVPQVGNVTLADRVDVGANSCIDRGTLGNTRVGRGTKIDNLVQIAHNVEIGQNSLLCGQVGIAGSAKVGNQVILGGNAGVSDHITVVDGCRFAAKTGVLSDVEKQGDYAGYPATPARQWHRSMAVLKNLPELRRDVSVLRESNTAVDNGNATLSIVRKT